MLWQRMFERKRVRLNQIGLDWAEVIENQIQRHSLNEMRGPVLAISDTTSINLERHVGSRRQIQTQDLGGQMFHRSVLILKLCR